MLHSPPRAFTPLASSRLAKRRPSYGTVASIREQSYNLDVPANTEEIFALQLDKDSRFYSRSRPRTIDLPGMLPYETESPQDRAKFLAHIVSHLYIAVKSLDIQGLLSISAKDLASLEEESGINDVDLAFDTNIFEMGADENGDDGLADLDDEDDDDDDDDDFEDEEDLELEDDALDAREEGPDDIESGESVMQHRKLPKSAAVVGVRIWTHELLVWMKLKYDMPLTLRMALARVYFAICTSRGQQLSLKIYVKTFEALTKDIELFRANGFILPWKQVYLELSNHFPTVDTLFEPFEKKDMSLLLRLAERALSFIEPTALPEIFRHIGSKFSIPNASLVLLALLLLPLPFNTDPDDPCDIRNYVPAFFHMWEKLSKSVGVDSHVTLRLGTISMAFLGHLARSDSLEPEVFGKFGVYNEPQFLFIMNTLLNSLSINSGKFASLRTKFFHGFASVIVFSMHGRKSLESDGVMNQIETLLNAIESYAYPSNSGDWSRPISKLISSLVYQFHKRFNLERQPTGSLAKLPLLLKLLDELVKRFVSCMLPLVRAGIQTRKNSVAEDYLSALGQLAFLDAEATLGFVLLDIYESLEGLISTHRVVSALRSLEELVRYFAATPNYRVHLARIMTLALPGIDSNDLSKTVHTLNFFAAAANFVPLYDLTKGEGDQGLADEFSMAQIEELQQNLYLRQNKTLLYDPELEVRALRSSTSIFKIFVKSMADRIFILLENIPDPSKSNGIEKDLCDLLPKFMYVIIEAMSDDIFKAFCEAVVNFITNNTVHTVADVIAEVCGGMIKRDPKYFLQLAPLLIERIREDVSENGAGKARTGVDIVPRDQALYWNLTILNECIGNAAEYVVNMEKELSDLSTFLMENVKGPTVFATTYILNQILQGVTKARLREARLISPEYEKKYGVDEKCWGGFQFDEYRFLDENLKFDWFFPTHREISFATSTFIKHTSRALSNIMKVLKEIASSSEKETNISLELSDDLRANFLYLAYGLSGTSYLFDPLFNEDIPKLSDSKFESINHRLQILALLRDMKSTKFSAIDEDNIMDIHENLREIVQDFELDAMKIDDSSQIPDDGFEYMDSRQTDSEETLNKEHTLKRVDSHVMSEPGSPGIQASGNASPRLAGIDMSSMNPAITFRERKLYTSNYYFGDDIETRKKNELYLEIHRVRHLIGKSLHVICRFMQKHLYDNTKLFKHLLYVLNIWFADLGRERVLDHSHARVSFSYINELQHINRVRKAYSRIAFSSRLETYHLLRVALHATSRTMTDLDRVLIEDIVRLSCSTYAAIAEPAQATLMDAMKRVNGSYNVIVKQSLRTISKALEENNFKKIESGLIIFELKRVKSKMLSDIYNLQKFAELLHRCLLVDNNDVNDVAQRLLKSLSGGVRPPSSVCLIDHELVDSIRPQDERIDLEIQAVTIAKNKKRRLYIEKLNGLEDVFVLHEKQNSHWKTSSLNLLFLVELQVENEMETRNDVLQLLTRTASSDHPLISRLALKGITRILSKLYMLSAFKYDLRKVYTVDFIPEDLVEIDTQPDHGESYAVKWREQLRTEPASYFVDHKANSGWLFWDDSFLAVTNKPCYNMKLNENDERVLQGFATCVNKAWLSNIVYLWITDNDANLAFQGTDVFVTAGIVMLISSKHIQNLLFQDLLDVITEIYDKDEKSTHIVVCELVAGILLASKTFDPALIETRDDFLVPFLKNIFENDLTAETKNIWNIFAWWIPAHIDCRRFPKIASILTDIHINEDSDSASSEASHLTYLRSFIASVTWGYPYPEAVVKLCFDNIANKYQIIREQVGSLMAVASFAFYGESFADWKTYIQAAKTNGPSIYKLSLKNYFHESIPDLFEQIDKWSLEVEDQLAQDMLKSQYIYAASTTLTWLKQALNTSTSVQYQDVVVTHLVPFLLKLTSMKDVCQLGNIEPISAFKRVSQIPFAAHNLEAVVAMLERYSSEKLNNVQFFILGEFTETIFFKNLFHLSKGQRRRILDLTVKMTCHKSLEVREASAATFSGLIHATPPGEIEEVVASYTNQFRNVLDKVRRKYRKSGFKNISSDDTLALHGATIGLGAIVHAFSFLSPPPKWIPEILTVLSDKSSGINGIVGRSAKETLSKFKKTRQDTWHVDSKVFNEQQVQALEGVLWKSYFI